MIRYIPVAEETFGGTPNLSNKGLKITPPPRPSAPATHPPKKPRNKTVANTFPRKTRSLGTRLTLLYFIFFAYSLATNLAERITTRSIMTINATKHIQYPALHFLKLTDSSFPPANIFKQHNPIRLTKLINYFFQIKWLLSCLISPLKELISAYVWSPLGTRGRPHSSQFSSFFSGMISAFFASIGVSSFFTAYSSSNSMAPALSSFLAFYSVNSTPAASALVSSLVIISTSPPS